MNAQDMNKLFTDAQNLLVDNSFYDSLVLALQTNPDIDPGPDFQLLQDQYSRWLSTGRFR